MVLESTGGWVRLTDLVGKAGLLVQRVGKDARSGGHAKGGGGTRSMLAVAARSGGQPKLSGGRACVCAGGCGLGEWLWWMRRRVFAYVRLEVVLDKIKGSCYLQAPRQCPTPPCVWDGWVGG